VLYASGCSSWLGSRTKISAAMSGLMWGGGGRLDSPALIADGNHARTDGFVSLGVIASALLVGLGFPRADPLIGLVITVVILKITWDSWRVISTTEPGEPVDEPHRH
jgi:divalent metal cation (Fe/Co/Zn/Cd) transporter